MLIDRVSYFSGICARNDIIICIFYIGCAVITFFSHFACLVIRQPLLVSKLVAVSEVIYIDELLCPTILARL
jgi:hypothetical protein